MQTEMTTVNLDHNTQIFGQSRQGFCQFLNILFEHYRMALVESLLISRLIHGHKRQCSSTKKGFEIIEFNKIRRCRAKFPSDIWIWLIFLRVTFANFTLSFLYIYHAFLLHCPNIYVRRNSDLHAATQFAYKFFQTLGLRYIISSGE